MQQNSKNQHLFFVFKKLGIRILIAFVIFLVVRYNVYADDFVFWKDKISLFYLFTSLALFILAWESNDYLIRKKFKHNLKALTLKSGLTIFCLNIIFLAPFIFLVYYFGIYHYIAFCPEHHSHPFKQLISDSSRAFVLSFAVVGFNLFYFSLTQKKELNQKIDQLNKELMSAQYQSLKNQISPHFLFNSLNTLTSLIYENPDLASDYTSRLAACYRYLLDHQKNDIVSLDKELRFLDSFIFMMTVRHPEAIHIKTDIRSEHKPFLIPTLSLQMLIENVLKHNIYSPQKPLHIHIQSNENLGITIENNLQKRNQQKNTTHLGIQNIQKRYKFYTSQKVSVTQTDQNYSITIPLISPKKRNL